MASSRKYPPVSPVSAGLKGLCPRCGEGRIFQNFLGVRRNCDACGLDLSFADTADGPAFFVMFAVGFAVVAAALAVEIMYQPPYWLHLALWLPLTLLLSVFLLRPLKGMLLAQQYRHNAQEGRLASK
ncbi:MAG: DUF983 domain-containing protein [Methyloligellaceae bacterium]